MNRVLSKQDKQAAEKLKVAYYRKKKGISQEQAAAELGWTQSGLAHYLNGRRRFNLLALVKICHFLGENPEDIHPTLVKEAQQVGIQVTQQTNTITNHNDHQTLQQLYPTLTQPQQALILKIAQEFAVLNK